MNVEPDPERELPFKSFFGLVSFVASIGVGLTLGAALNVDIDGRHLYAYAVALFAGGLTASVAGAFLLTDARAKFALLSDPTAMDANGWSLRLNRALAVLAYGSLALISAAMLTIGVAVLELRTGAGVLYLVLVGGVALVCFVFWAVGMRDMPSVEMSRVPR